MKLRFLFHIAAEPELNEAAVYYEKSSAGLGRSFLDDVERAIDQIKHYPESGYLLNQAIRRVLLRRFPYAVMYSVRRDEIKVLAIANLKRRPFYWRGRK
jgi:plasmid stabilization system protein ParE